MITWDLVVQFGKRTYTLMAEVERPGAKSMRITVYGMKGAIILRNNYPALHSISSNKPMMWALVGGKLDENNPQVAKLLADIIQQLEPLIRNKFPFSIPLFL